MNDRISLKMSSVGSCRLCRYNDPPDETNEAAKRDNDGTLPMAQLRLYDSDHSSELIPLCPRHLYDLTYALNDFNPVELKYV